mmetsp:Transcript_79343/g.119283  ORF Transcript_79343/g.119283 Transcript_79343/m.119283 type:complete len:418 (+) Transcript_79343:198-1451(+)
MRTTMMNLGAVASAALLLAVCCETSLAFQQQQRRIPAIVGRSGSLPFLSSSSSSSSSTSRQRRSSLQILHVATNSHNDFCNQKNHTNAVSAVTSAFSLPEAVRDSSSASSRATTTTISTTPTQEEATTSSINNTINKDTKTRFIRLAHLLSFHSGILNAIFLAGLLGRSQAVGPVTDSWSKLGTALACGDTEKASFVARILLSFGVGSMMTGVLMSTTTVNGVNDVNGVNGVKAGASSSSVDIMTERTKPLLLAGTLVAISATLVARAVALGNPIPVLAFQCVSAANGLQNSFSSSWSQSVCRTSHMTGTYTDLCRMVGTYLKRQCGSGTNGNGNNAAQRQKLRTYTGLIVTFWLGGYLGSLVTKTAADVVWALRWSSVCYLMTGMPFGRLYQGMSRKRRQWMLLRQRRKKRLLKKD